MSSPRNSPSSRLSHSSSLPSRLSLSLEHHHARTPTPTSTRRRNDSHLRSSIFDSPIISRMAPSLAPLPPFQPGHAPQNEGETIHRDHSQVSFEWQILGVEWLKHSLEKIQISEWTVDYEVENPEVLPELLRRGIIIGDGLYRLELARTISPPHTPHTPIEVIAASAPQPGEPGPPQTLSLYITSLACESSPLEYSAKVFVGIKPPDSSIGRRFGETHWTWHHTTEHDFSKDTEFLEVTLPLLDELVLSPGIAQSNSFCLCVQIGSPADQKPAFNLPEMVYVPPSMISGLANLIDSKSGDMHFVCLEHSSFPVDPHAADVGLEEALGKSERSPNPMLSRKRALYAHSEILRARSEYFKTLLGGEFAEMEHARSSESKHITIVVDDASFNTVYWMLKFIYCNELSFAPDEDVRGLMDQLQLDRTGIQKLLRGPHWGSGEWDYRQMPSEGDAGLDSLSELDMRDDFDARTVRSVSSAGTSVSRRVSAMSPPPPVPVPASTKGKGRERSLSSAASTVSKVSSASAASSTASKPVSRVSATTSSSATPRSRVGPAPGPGPGLKLPSTSTPARSPSSNPGTKGVKDSTMLPTGSATSPKAIGRNHHPLRHVPEPDPHAHPTQEPAPASALAVYMLAHRYRLTVLEGLAKDHILSRLTFDNCMPMLLATYRYENLHSEVLDYVVECFGSVQISPEFKECIKEVSQGLWGEEGGQVILGLFSRF